MVSPTPGSPICKPRFATPRDESFPTLGPQVGEVARRLGRPLMPWQQAAVDVAYEYDPDSGLFRYDEADITVPRQSGKTTITLAKKVHRLTVLSSLWGPQRSTYTAQSRLKARNKLERDFAELLRSSRSFREVANAKARPSKGTEWRLSLNNGSEHLQFGRGSFLQIDAPSRTGGHGDTLDDGTIDEAFAQKDDTVEGGMRPSMATRRNAQLWVISTAGDGESKYLWRKILAGRKATATGEHGRTCYIEYSADEDADPADPKTWWGCMPALGITITEQFIESEWDRAARKGAEGIDTFRRAYLNQWPEIPVLDDDQGDRVFLAAFRELGDPRSTIIGTPKLAVSMSRDQQQVTLAASGPREDGRLHVEVVEHGPAGDWFVPKVAEIAKRQKSRVWLHPGHPVGALMPELIKAGVGIETLNGTDYAQGCGGLHRAVLDGSLRYPSPQPELDAAVARATQKRSGETWKWDGTGITALVAVTQAAHAARSAPTGKGRVVLLAN